MTSTRKVLRLGLVGRGRWGGNIERTLLSFPDVTVIPVRRDGGDIGDFDGVVIATPGATHAALALPYIEAGVPTFIEKPMATSVADAQSLREAADRSGAPVFVGHIHLYNPAFHKILEMLPALGAVRYVLFEGMNDNRRGDSSVLWDWLPHHLSMARAIFGLDAASAQAWSLADTAIPQAAVSRFRFGATPVVSIASWLSPIRRRHMTLTCEGGTLVFDDTAERKLTVHAMTGEVAYPTYEAIPPLTREMAAFLDMVRGGPPDRDHIADAIAIARAIAAAERSLLDAGSTVTV